MKKLLVLSVGLLWGGCQLLGTISAFDLMIDQAYADCRTVVVANSYLKQTLESLATHQRFRDAFETFSKKGKIHSFKQRSNMPLLEVDCCNEESFNLVCDHSGDGESLQRKLVVAISMGSNAFIEKVLHNAGKDINYKDGYPLFVALSLGLSDVALWIIKSGATIHDITWHDSLLPLAIDCFDLSLIETLIAKGIRVEQQKASIDGHDLTALEYAVKKANDFIDKKIPRCYVSLNRQTFSRADLVRVENMLRFILGALIKIQIEMIELLRPYYKVSTDLEAKIESVIESYKKISNEYFGKARWEDAVDSSGPSRCDWVKAVLGV